MREFTETDLRKIVSDAYTEYGQACREFRLQAQAVRKLKKDLEYNILESYAQGLIEGKNQKERDAAEFAMFKFDIQEIEIEEQQEAELYMVKEQAEIEVEYVRALLRIEELAQEK